MKAQRDNPGFEAWDLYRLRTKIPKSNPEALEKNAIQLRDVAAQAFEKNPNDEAALLALGKLALENNPEEALAYADRAVKQDSENIYWMESQLLALRALRQMGDEEKVFNRLIDIVAAYPHMAAVYPALQQEFHIAGASPRRHIISKLDAAIAEDPGNGRLLAVKGMYDSMIAAYGKLDPKYVDPQFSWAETFGVLEKAVELQLTPGTQRCLKIGHAMRNFVPKSEADTLALVN